MFETSSATYPSNWSGLLVSIARKYRISILELYVAVSVISGSSDICTFTDSDHLLNITPLLNADKGLFLAFLKD